MPGSSLDNTEGSGGGPEPGGPLSDRQQTFFKLLVALILVGILSLRVGALWDQAWEADGLGRGFIIWLTSNFDIDVAIVFPVGVVIGWLILFVIDRTKKLQRWLAVAAALLVIVWIVAIEDRWTDQVAWHKYWYLVIFGVGFGWISGAITQLTPRGRQREFPVAATGLFAVVAILSIVAFFDVHVIATEQVEVSNENVFFTPGTPVGATINALATVGFVSLFGWFVLYSDYRSVAVLSTSQGLGLAVMSGLLDHTQKHYSGRSRIGGVLLSNFKDPLVQGVSGSDLPSTDSDSRFEFTYLPPTTSARWIHVSAVPITISELNDDTARNIGRIASNPRIGRRSVVLLRDNLLPGRIKRALASNTGLLTDRIADANAVILVLSIEDFDGYQPDTEIGFEDLSSPDSVKRFTTLCSQLDSSKKRIIVLTDAERVLHLSDSTSITDNYFSGFLRGQLLDVDSEYTVVPVSWTDDSSGGGEDTLVVGIDRLRRALEE